MAEQGFTPDTYHRVQEAISDVIDVSVSSARLAKPVLYSGIRTLYIQRAYFILTANAAVSTATVELGTAADPNKFATALVTSALVAGDVIEADLDESNREIDPNTIVDAGHTQDADNTADGYWCVHFGVSSQ